MQNRNGLIDTGIKLGYQRREELGSGEIDKWDSRSTNFQLQNYKKEIS